MNANLTDYFYVQGEEGGIVRKLLTVDDFPHLVLLQSFPWVMDLFGVIGNGSAEGPTETAWQVLEEKIRSVVIGSPKLWLILRREMRTPGTFSFELIGIFIEEQIL